MPERDEYDAYSEPFGEIPAPIPSVQRYPQDYFSHPELFVSEDIGIVRGLDLRDEPIMNMPAVRNTVRLRKGIIGGTALAAGIAGVVVGSVVFREQRKTSA